MPPKNDQSITIFKELVVVFIVLFGDFKRISISSFYRTFWGLTYEELVAVVFIIFFGD